MKVRSFTEYLHLLLTSTGGHHKTRVWYLWTPEVNFPLCSGPTWISLQPYGIGGGLKKMELIRHGLPPVLCPPCISFLWLLEQMTTHSAAGTAHIYPLLVLEARSGTQVSQGENQGAGRAVAVRRPPGSAMSLPFPASGGAPMSWLTAHSFFFKAAVARWVLCTWHCSDTDVLRLPVALLRTHKITRALGFPQLLDLQSGSVTFNSLFFGSCLNEIALMYVPQGSPNCPNWLEFFSSWIYQISQAKSTCSWELFFSITFHDETASALLQPSFSILFCVSSSLTCLLKSGVGACHFLSPTWCGQCHPLHGFIPKSSLSLSFRPLYPRLSFHFRKW